jgi:hypothetical protein
VPTISVQYPIYSGRNTVLSLQNSILDIFTQHQSTHAATDRELSKPHSEHLSTSYQDHYILGTVSHSYFSPALAWVQFDPPPRNFKITLTLH